MLSCASSEYQVGSKDRKRKPAGRCFKLAAGGPDPGLASPLCLREKDGLSRGSVLTAGEISPAFTVSISDKMPETNEILQTVFSSVDINLLQIYV